MHQAIATLTGAALALSIAAAAPAQNLVANGDFDDDILDWENLDATKQWNAFDPFDDPLSGSLRISNTGIGSTVFVNQCVEIQPNVTYGFQVWAFAFQDGGGNGSADVRLRWFTGAVCSGDLADTLVYQSAEQGEWERLADTVAAPANAVSADIRLGARKFGEGASPELLVYFDSVYLPEPGTAAGAIAIATIFGLRRRPGIDDEPTDARESAG